MEEVRQKVNFIGSHQDMRGEVKRHGYRITRILVPVPADVLKRTWGRGKRKLWEGELQQVDLWLSQEQYDTAAIVRLVNYYLGFQLKTEHDLQQLLLRSGYAWRYTLEKNILDQ